MLKLGKAFVAVVRQVSQVAAVIGLPIKFAGGGRLEETKNVHLSEPLSL
jgi:hypothetical protein